MKNSPNQSRIYYKKEGMWKQTFKRLAKKPMAMIGLGIIILFVVISFLAPYITRYTYSEMDTSAINQAPSAEHWFGTDSMGRDLFSRILYGGRFTLGLGFSASIMSTIIGIILGSIAGYYGSWVDNLVMRLCDIVQSIPGQLLCLIISATLGIGYINTIIALTIGGIVKYVRLLRGSILSVRKEEYLEAAVSINCSSARIMFKHLLPNVISPIIVSFSMGIGYTIMMAAGLSVIGLGVQPPTPEWGAMLADGRSLIRNYPYQVLFPGLMILITVMGFNLLGDGLRDALDPKLKK